MVEDAERRGFPGINTSVPNLARMTDYLLGGKDNFAADRLFAKRLLAIAPEINTMAHDVRDFVGRVVRFLAGEGITQFVNVASWLPTQRNTHEIAQEVVPDARVVYVDDDPVVLAHARALLARDEHTGVVKGSILRPAELLESPEMRRFIDFDRPVGMLIPTRLMYTPDSHEPYKAVAQVRDRLAPGSFLAMGHTAYDSRPELVAPMVELFRQMLPDTDELPRTVEQVRRFFAGTELVEPGVVYIRKWRPDHVENTTEAQRVWIVGGVGRVR
ncbi:hypothetical protein Sru01_50790 [Sphaerisporangium rufum]|uniref:SAM-dependent methyltransferase n=1 Tax=Sphaerisporangium rufum TaxID=1381558 RepID=A0A919V2V2_9ACTN|nr:SAM-dependent methyltransferase [Sphaerisporangium rufum]GII80097.1 hypothetical protein Sru01_50790 [Sphaerisporangium rufum]